MNAVGLTRLGLGGTASTNKTAPRFTLVGGAGAALGIGVALLLVSGSGAPAGAATVSGSGASIAGSGVGTITGRGVVVGRSHGNVTRLGLTGAPFGVRPRGFTGISAKSWSVTSVAAMAAVVTPFDTFAINFAMRANIAANATATPIATTTAAGTCTVIGRSGASGSSSGAASVAGSGQALSNLFGVGIGNVQGIATLAAASPTVGAGSADGSGALNGVVLGLGTMAAAGTAAGSGAAAAVGVAVQPGYAMAVGQCVGMGWAYGVAPIDNTPPTPPTLVIASNITLNSLRLDWSGSTDLGGSGLAGYLLTRNGTSITAIAVSDTFYQDAGLQGGQTYIYQISAIDNAGNRSVGNPSISVTTALTATTLTTVVIWRKDKYWS